MNCVGLEGRWKLCVLPGAQGGETPEYDDEIILPGTLSMAGKGPVHADWAAGHLTDPRAFRGAAWFSRDLEIREEWEERELFLFLERTRSCRVFVDGEAIGSDDSLCAPQVYPLPPLSPGRHTLELRVENGCYPVPGGHMTSEDTQTDWIGVTGRLELLIRPVRRLDGIRILSGSGGRRVTVQCTASRAGEAVFRVDNGAPQKKALLQGRNTLNLETERELAAWDEFSPALHALTAEMGGEEQRISFGIRTLTARGRRLLINGRETFLRGKHDGMVFPLTGAAPWEKAEWLRVMGIAKGYGINHYRFHTCCPPEAAFEAADELGICLEPELPFWGTVPDEETGSTRYLAREGFRILDAYGNHPSFAMLSLGNELWGSEERLNALLGEYRAYDDRHLYTDGSNNYQFVPRCLSNADFLAGVRLGPDRLYRGSYAMCDAPQGFIQTAEPNTVHTYDAALVPETAGALRGGRIRFQRGTKVEETYAAGAGSLVPQVPVISHEIGQYAMYPDFGEIERYTGVLQPYNLILDRERARKEGMLEYADAFFRASGALAADCYRRELEAALKTKELAGFQLLDLQDFPGQGTALVGILNALMEPKGVISREEWRAFCAPSAVLAALERFVYREGEDIPAEFFLVSTDPAVHGGRIRYTLESEGELLIRGACAVTVRERVNSAGRVLLHPFRTLQDRPRRVTLRLELEDTGIVSAYSLMVYPDLDITIDTGRISAGERCLRVVSSRDEARRRKAAGEKVLLIPGREGKLPGSYCTDFWNWDMFSAISRSMGKPEPVGTLGCLIDAGHPALSLFPTQTWSTPAWYHLIEHSHCEDLTGTGIVPIVWVIDNARRARRLGMLYGMETDAGSIPVCTSRLWEIREHPEVRWFAASLLEYAYRE